MENNFSFEDWLSVAPAPLREAFAEMKKTQDVLAAAQEKTFRAQQSFHDAQAIEDQAERKYDESVAKLVSVIDQTTGVGRDTQ